MVHFVGAGPGAADLITLRGAELLRHADVLIWAGSLVNPELLALAPAQCEVHDSARLTLEAVIALIERAEAAGKTTVRLHSGDTSLYGAIYEQAEALRVRGISFDVTPGVSSFSAAAAALGTEYTVPGVSQSLIITRAAGRTPVPEREALKSLAAHGASMALFLSAGLAEHVQRALLEGGAYTEDTPCAVVYKASWPEERVLHCSVKTLVSTLEEAGIQNSALILVGDFLEDAGERSRLYDPAFSTGYREASA